MFASGDTSLTPRMVVERGWTCMVYCSRCNYGAGQHFREPAWQRNIDRPFVILWPKMRCSRTKDGKFCRGAISMLTVSRRAGQGSQSEEMLRLAERLE